MSRTNFVKRIRDNRSLPKDAGFHVQSVHSGRYIESGMGFQFVCSCGKMYDERRYRSDAKKDMDDHTDRINKNREVVK